MINKIFKKLKLKFYKLLPNKFLLKIISKKRGVLVLMYHSIIENESAYGYAISKSIFEEHLKILNEYFNVISIDEFYNTMFKNKNKFNKPTVVITFDDGYKNNYQKAYPLLKQFNFPFTIFIATNFITQNNKTFLTWEEIKTFIKEYDKVTFGSHSINHFNLSSLEKEDQFNEIVKSKKVIYENIRKEVNYFAYPSGGYNEYCLEIVGNNYLLGFKDRMNDNNLNKTSIGRISIDKRHERIKDFLIELNDYL